MNSDQIGGIVRAVMMGFAGFAFEHGVTEDQWLAITGGIVTLVAVAWSLYSNSTPKMINTVAEKPVVSKVVVKDPGLIASIPSTKVTAK